MAIDAALLAGILNKCTIPKSMFEHTWSGAKDAATDVVYLIMKGM